jgi:methylated-DNA-[protein]-cysteine S-methyltransferase
VTVLKYAYYYETKIGKLMIAEDGQSITDISLVSEEEGMNLSSQVLWKETELTREAYGQLSEYMEGTRRQFTVPLNPQGTVFQRKVWEALRNIPYGETRSYKQIAEAVGNGKASRAVGMANHNNPIICMIPCHRVIGANGCLVGYAGGLDIKKQLLELEQGKED